MEQDFIDALYEHETDLLDRYLMMDDDTPLEKVEEVLEKIAIVQVRLMLATRKEIPNEDDKGPTP